MVTDENKDAQKLQKKSSNSSVCVFFVRSYLIVSWW